MFSSKFINPLECIKRRSDLLPLKYLSLLKLIRSVRSNGCKKTLEEETEENGVLTKINRYHCFQLKC